MILIVRSKSNQLTLEELSDKVNIYDIEQKFELDDNNVYFCVVVEYTTCSTFSSKSTAFAFLTPVKTRQEAQKLIDIINSEVDDENLSYRESKDAERKLDDEKAKLLGYSYTCPWIGHFEELEHVHLLTWTKL